MRLWRREYSLLARSPDSHTARPRQRSRTARGAKMRRRKTFRKTSSVSAPTPPNRTEPAHKPSQVQPADRASEGAEGFIPKPVHLKLLSTYEACFQDGIAPTDGVIAKRLNVRRETINRWRRRNSQLRAWLFERIGQHAVELKPLVDRRVAQQAIAGSPDHQKLFYQFVAKVGLPAGDEGDGPPVAGASIVMNYLVPRPETPVIPGVTVREVVPQLLESTPGDGKMEHPPSSDPVPFVKVR